MNENGKKICAESKNVRVQKRMIEKEPCCDMCGKPLEYNPYQDFWYESCGCKSRNILDVLRDLFLDNLKHDLNESVVYPIDWIKFEINS